MTDEARRAASLDQLRRDTSNLPSRVTLAKIEVKNGSDPKYVAMKYGLGEDFIAACEQWKRNQETKREQRLPTSGDRTAPESR